MGGLVVEQDNAPLRGGLERDFVRRLACLSSVDVGWQKQRGALPACSQHSVVLYAFPV